MPSSETADVAILGDGLIGLSCAYALSARGVACVVVGRRRAGFASTAAAGLLAPTIDPAPGAALDFALAARGRFPSFVRELHAATGFGIPLAFDGILRVAATEAEAEALRRESGSDPIWLVPGEVAALEPHVHAPLGALLHREDGAVDNRSLLDALEAALSLGAVRRRATLGLRVELGAGTAVVTDDGGRIACGFVVVAAGAWSPRIHGLPRRLPIVPLRGQMLALEGTFATRPILGAGGYLVPRRGGETVVGSTSEDVGFAAGTSADALATLRETARSLTPPLAGARVRDAWSGLRPMTPDALPIIGADPEVPTLVYACGHSRNGILMAPITGDAVAAVVRGERFAPSLEPFRVSRFRARNQATG